ncbi:MAG TPA: hypothetical protein VF779_14870 [Pyrinomonadaceae bacterium]
MTATTDYYRSGEEIETVVRDFESCTTKPEDFNHRAHLTVAFAYLHLFRLNVAEATDRMRAGLYRFVDHNDIDRQKYNETITIFWIKRVHSFLAGADTERLASDIANEMIEACGGTKLVYEYYSKERLSTDEARTMWVEPDVKALDF